MPIYEETTVDEAIRIGLQTLGLTKDDVAIEILEEAKRGFLGMGKKNAQVSIEPLVSEAVTEVVIEDVIDNEAPLIQEENVDDSKQAQFEDLDDEAALTELALYLTNISKELQAPALVRTERTEGLIVMHLETNKQGILIGKHGKVLNSLQYLAQVFIHRAAKNKLSIVINVGDYREKRQAILQRLAERTAEKVKYTGQPVFLDPMPAFERKQIHSVLSKDEYVKTHSEGDEPYRYLVVEPAKKYF